MKIKLAAVILAVLLLCSCGLGVEFSPYSRFQMGIIAVYDSPSVEGRIDGFAIHASRVSEEVSEDEEIFNIYPSRLEKEEVIYDEEAGCTYYPVLIDRRYEILEIEMDCRAETVERVVYGDVALEMILIDGDNPLPFVNPFRMQPNFYCSISWDDV